MKKTAFVAVTIIAVLALFVSACGAPAPEPTAPPPPPEAPTAAPEATPTEAAPEPVVGTPYRLGFCSAQTGGGSSLGMPERYTAEMIAERLEEAGGVVGPDGVVHDVEVLIYDTESSPDVATTVASRLIEEDEVDVLVCGSLSGNSVGIATLVAEAEIPYISMASARAIVEDPETGEVRHWVFKTPQDNGQVATLQTMYLEDQGVSSVCCLYENTGFGQDCLNYTHEYYEASGIEVLYEDSFERTDTEFPQIAGVSGSGCEMLTICAIPPGASMVTVAAREGLPDLPIIHNHGVCNMAYIDLAGEAANDTVFPCGRMTVADQLPDDNPQKQLLLDYIADYTEFTGGEPFSTFGGHALDGLLWAIEGMESLPEGLALEERRAAIRDYIETEIKDWPGTGGVFNVSADDHLGLTYEALVMLMVEDGAWVYFPPEDW